jgi:hypothetical protein
MRVVLLIIFHTMLIGDAHCHRGHSSGRLNVPNWMGPAGS